MQRSCPPGRCCVVADKAGLGAMRGVVSPGRGIRRSRHHTWPRRSFPAVPIRCSSPSWSWSNAPAPARPDAAVVHPETRRRGAMRRTAGTRPPRPLRRGQGGPGPRPKATRLPAGRTIGPASMCRTCRRRHLAGMEHPGAAPPRGAGSDNEDDIGRDQRPAFIRLRPGSHARARRTRRVHRRPRRPSHRR